MSVTVCVEPTRASKRLTVAAVLRDGLGRMAVQVSSHRWKVLRAILACRTGALGGSTYQCEHCQREHTVAFGCGNRHCPDCQGRLALQWLKQQQSRLLQAPYFHLVFTLPHALNPLIRQNQWQLYELLLGATSETVLEFGRNRLKGQLGLTMVLHTWGQRLVEHYHVHAIVTGGALDEQSRWQQVRNMGYLFSITALSLVFRGKFCAGLQQLRQEGRLDYHGEQAGLKEEAAFQGLVREATAKRWVVYAKKPFAGPETVLRYLSNYTHRVGMSSKRLLALDENNHRVIFRYRDYAQGGRSMTMALETGEFARRFCLHILPKGFCKVRHYGLLANRARDQRLERARKAIAAANRKDGCARDEARRKARQPPAVTALPSARCPYCQSPRLRLVRVTHRPRKGQPGADSS